MVGGETPLQSALTSYTPPPHTHTGEMLSTGLMPSPAKRVKRVTATDGSEDALKGKCVFFLRPSNVKSVTTSNVAEELLCGCLDASNGRCVLEVVQEYLSQVMLPALQNDSRWGPLQPTQVNNFMNTLKAYITFLQSESIATSIAK